MHFLLRYLILCRAKLNLNFCSKTEKNKSYFLYIPLQHLRTHSFFVAWSKHELFQPSTGLNLYKQSCVRFILQFHVTQSMCFGSSLTSRFPLFVISSYLHRAACRTFQRRIRERVPGLVELDQSWSLLCRHCIDCSVSHTLDCSVQERNATSLTSLFVALSLWICVSA